MKTFFALIFVFCLSSGLIAQVAPGEYAPGEILVQLKPGFSPADLSGSLQEKKLKTAELKIKRALAGNSSLQLLTFDNKNTPDQEILEAVRQLPAVELAQFNYRVAYRNTIPDDPDYVSQWNMDMINAPEIWDVTTGGETALGDEIVIAVLDDGIDLEHVDLQENFWVNPGEIDGDNIDNDGNGYVDDYNGWNWDSWDDEHFVRNHGSVISGIIGGEGDNGTGISGVNWKVKILFISAADYNDEIVEAYTYIRDLRRKYNETDGEEGAFIVATNASFGIDNKFCADLPIWGAMYDSLGMEGVLSVGATTNSNYDVDVVGDMPTSCPSDFLLTVTNTDETDTKVAGAGYGATTIDLGAPGENIFSTKIDNEYGQDGGGTSFSAPHVSGAIGLLYSIPCNSVAELARTNPSEAALLVKKFILDGAENNNTSLQNITVSGGRLDLGSSMSEVRAYCGGKVGELALADFYPNPTDGILNIKVQSSDLARYTLNIHDRLGRTVHTEQLEIGEYFANTITLDLSPLSQGLYFVSLNTVREVVTKKLFIY